MNFFTRELTENDWQILKKIRLEALKLHPNFFAPSRDEFKFTEADWKERLNNPDSATIILLNENVEPIGLTGIVRDKEDRSIAWLVSSYIHADYRHKGLTRYLYEARIKWAKEQGDIHSLVVHHRDDNEASRRSHQKFNFQFIKAYPPTTWPNGDVKPYVEFRLKIK